MYPTQARHPPQLEARSFEYKNCVLCENSAWWHKNILTVYSVVWCGWPPLVVAHWTIFRAVVTPVPESIFHPITSSLFSLLLPSAENFARNILLNFFRSEIWIFYQIRDFHQHLCEMYKKSFDFFNSRNMQDLFLPPSSLVYVKWVNTPQIIWESLCLVFMQWYLLDVNGEVGAAWKTGTKSYEW